MGIFVSYYFIFSISISIYLLILNRIYITVEHVTVEPDTQGTLVR